MSEAVPSMVAIDIGTHKVSVLIAKVHAPDHIHVIGMATAPNRGMHKGKIVNIEKVIAAIKNAVSEAENMADCRVNSAWVSIPCTELQSHYATGRTAVATPARPISTADVARALDLAKKDLILPEYYLASAIPLGFELDGVGDWVQNPIDLMATSLVGHYQLMMMPIATMQNLDRAIKAANITVEKMVVSSLACAEASLLQDEKDYGVCLIDIGAGITTLSVYIEGHLAEVYTIQKGGENVTRDIATVLQTTTEEAERLKLLHGCVELSLIKPDHMIQIETINGAQTISRIELAEIIIARYEDIFSQIHQALNSQGAIHALYHGVVLAGDACQIEGMVNLSRRMLGVSAHLGNAPLAVVADDNLLPALRRSKYATAAGLLMFSQSDLQESVKETSTFMPTSFFARFANACSALNQKFKQFF